MTTPMEIAGIHYRLPIPANLIDTPLATLTIQCGPLVVTGFTANLNADGRCYLRPPKMRHVANRVAILAGAERSALTMRAYALLTEFLQAHGAAVPPLATASEPTEARE